MRELGGLPVWVEEYIREVFSRWAKPSHIRLHCGEFSASEMRSVLAVISALRSEIGREILDQNEKTR
jgi:hypothetical protein